MKAQVSASSRVLGQYRHLPTAGHDVALEAAGAATGVLLGVLATALTRIRRDHADAAIITAGPMFAALWIIVIGGRMAFAELVSRS